MILLKKIARKILPLVLVLYIKNIVEKIQLVKEKKRVFNYMSLHKKIDLKPIFLNSEFGRRFKDNTEKINSCKITEGFGGVNKGDRRAIFHLINNFIPKNILEIGTHLGSSTVTMALSIDQRKSHITTVDILDVNDTNQKPWIKYKSPYSPYENLLKLKLNDKVNFKVSNSINFLSETKEKYDFIFLDGNHSAKFVYREVSLSLNLLNENGIILLHDYFPNGKKIWPNGNLIVGPYLAMNRIKSENSNIEIVPLNSLPWETKEGTNISSLAIVMRKN